MIKHILSKIMYVNIIMP